LKGESSLKSSAINEDNQKISELKAELNVLRNQITKTELELEKASYELKKITKESYKNESENKTIRKVIPINNNSSIFGVILKKTDQDFLHQAKLDSEKNEALLNIVWADKIDELRKLKKNIISMSPKTISSRATPDELEDFDYDDEKAFEKMLARAEQRENDHHRVKEKLQKLKDEQDRVEKSKI